MAKPLAVMQQYTRLSSTWKTVDLPASDGTPVEIDCSDAKTLQVVIYIAYQFYVTAAADATTGASNLGSDDTRCNWPAGFYSFDISEDDTLNLYIKSTDSATTDGISYTYTEV